ncbi:uncharacterized protein [Leptinotarsa decemlineata]|uniref:uncharacterized protein n=1 Tax=Leptinotarsa decemlineata TaxID=7539 RepID=UPI003D30D3B7
MSATQFIIPARWYKANKTQVGLHRGARGSLSSYTHARDATVIHSPRTNVAPHRQCSPCDLAALAADAARDLFCGVARFIIHFLNDSSASKLAWADDSPEETSLEESPTKICIFLVYISKYPHKYRNLPLK